MVDIFHYPFPLYRLFFCPANRVWGHAALEAFLQNHPEVDELELCTDNDRAGRWAAQNIAKHYSKEYMVTVNLPPIEGYDWADMAKEEKEKRAARNRAACLDREL